MKSIVKLISLSLMLATCLWACTKDENREYILGGTNPVLTASSTAPLVLNVLNQNNAAISFSWTNPNYQFTTGVSSQDVSYALQFDTTGANFTNPKLQTKSISKDLAVTLTVKELNAILLSMDLLEGKAQNIEIRLVASFAGSTVPLTSNVIKIVITPYLDVKYPLPTNLFITGGATPLSWQCGCAADLTTNYATTQKFAKISSTAFQLTVTLTAGQSYLLLPVYGDWSNKYGFDGANNANNTSGDNFKPNGGDILSPAVTKAYKITVDFKTGKFTVQ
jgi:hypothetical protein